MRKLIKSLFGPEKFVHFRSYIACILLRSTVQSYYDWYAPKMFTHHCFTLSGLNFKANPKIIVGASLSNRHS
ncbi:hypothetical protein QR98_0101380 [Sarcoptes scabiei]|uniref:Uncharacterized protein n=1 Tax=Sarcoptes scabiei TaxID=52283 RepID=A0A132ALV0_SARSC|nr:hypothetical protein QR98_0101380 [Sarcoptes scabiei]